MHFILWPITNHSVPDKNSRMTVIRWSVLCVPPPASSKLDKVLDTTSVVAEKKNMFI